MDLAAVAQPKRTMARTKNQNRRKRKYTDVRKTITERNRTLTTSRHDRQLVRAVARTADLIGKPVYFRTQDGIKKQTGTVISVINKQDERYPTEATRNVGNYLEIRDSSGRTHLKSRHRVKPIREENAV